MVVTKFVVSNNNVSPSIQATAEQLLRPKAGCCAPALVSLKVDFRLLLSRLPGTHLGLKAWVEGVQKREQGLDKDHLSRSASTSECSPSFSPVGVRIESMQGVGCRS